MEILLAIVLGAAFGAVLDRIGASNPAVIGKMLALINLNLMKSILLAIGFASVLMFGGLMLDLVDVGHMSVKTAYVGVFLGGLLLGFGWALSGYCPGTGVVALGTGRRDALAFVAGGLLGASAYMVTYPSWKSSGLLDAVAGGAVTIGTIPGSKYEGLTSLPGDVVGIFLGLVFIVIAFMLPNRLSKAPIVQPAE
jgi:uncharacterized membrane protein YedE/YeeE